MTLLGLALLVLFVTPVGCVIQCVDFAGGRAGSCEVQGCSSLFGMVDYPGSIHGIRNLFPLVAGVLLLASGVLALRRRRSQAVSQFTS